ncbi:MAG: glycosyltransferase family 2 protein [Sulfuricaulis sp.]|nr:glycosyltransferase family 2 protein [Sulfuricaulis sp.]
MNISLCIATYRRPERLSALLDDLVKQQLLPNEVVVVDNDAAGSARAVVERRRALGAAFPIHYDIQPVKNISLTRNRTVEIASGDWIAFIDDDERAPASWLEQLAATATGCAADGVLGPVAPIVPIDAPPWIRRGSFYDWARMKTGAVIPLNKLRFGNVLLRGDRLRATPTPFDPNYGLTGGEDGDLLGRLVQQGARIVWCDEAIVHEPVEAARLSLRWLLLRALRGGQDFARHKLSGHFGHLTSAGRVRLFLRALVQSAMAAGLALLSWPRGRHRAVHWLLKASANLGKMSIFLGWHYREYGDKVA